jgi:hypothetical protein
MEPRLMKESLKDYIEVMRGRYGRRRGKRVRSALLDEFCQTAGLERKYALKVLRGQRRQVAGGRPRGAPVLYTVKDVGVLKAVWLLGGQPCGKRFAGEMLGLWLTSWEKRHGTLGQKQRSRIVGISAAQLDRVLGIYRTAGRKRRIASSALAAMQREIAVRCEPWAETAPGALEIDTVALCGGSMSGAIVWALDATDIHSGWTEVRAAWNRGAHATRERMSQIEAALPFVLRVLDFDNGSEFLNAHFISHFRAHQPRVELSRSRPYRKNDNAHIEQKNYTHVRLLLGDDRFDRYELVEPLNEVLALWSVWNNLYGAQRRLLRKERAADGKVRRYHEKKAATPCARLLAHEDCSVEAKARLQALLAAHDPITLREQIEVKLKVLYRMRAELEQENEPDLPAPEAASTPGGDSPGKAGLRSARSLAYGSHRSQRSGPPSPARNTESKEALPKPAPRTKHQARNQPLTVSSTVRHRAAS